MRQALLHPSAAAPSSSPPAVSLPSMRVAELERGTLDGGDVLFTGQQVKDRGGVPVPFHPFSSHALMLLVIYDCDI